MRRFTTALLLVLALLAATVRPARADVRPAQPPEPLERFALIGAVLGAAAGSGIGLVAATSAVALGGWVVGGILVGAGVLYATQHIANWINRSAFERMQRRGTAPPPAAATSPAAPAVPAGMSLLGLQTQPGR